MIKRKEGTITMKSPGDPQYYVADNVEYSMRLTDHGEYFTAAPWYLARSGLSVQSRMYQYEHCGRGSVVRGGEPGDVVWVNWPTGRPWRKDNGISVWNETWDGWAFSQCDREHTFTGG